MHGEVNMDSPTYITSFCSIRQQQLVVNGKVVFEGKLSLKKWLEEAYTFLEIAYPKFYKMDTLCQLGFLASDRVVAGKDLKLYQPNEVAVVLANKNASLDTDLAFHDSISKMASPALFVYTLPNIVTGEICIRQGWKGENAFFVQEAFDVDFQVNYVDSLLRKGNAKACLAGWVDVMGEDHDVFLYLVEKEKREEAIALSREELLKLYTTNYGSIDGRSESSDH